MPARSASGYSLTRLKSLSLVLGANCTLLTFDSFLITLSSFNLKSQEFLIVKSLVPSLFLFFIFFYFFLIFFWRH